MSVNLREALEELIVRLDANPCLTVGTYDVECAISNVLKAHPADTETEWGVMRVDDGTVIILSSRETACELILSDERIVSRKVTPWETVA